MPKITVLKPFGFSRKPKDGQGLPLEQTFRPGDHEIDDEMAAHPWIANHFADGCIETPEATAARTKLAADKAAQAATDAEQARIVAEAAFARLNVVHARGTLDSEEAAKDLETPVGTLTAKQGVGIDMQNPELNTPVNVLQEEQSKRVATMGKGRK